MEKLNDDHIRSGHEQSFDHLIYHPAFRHHPTYREIYESINHRDDFNESQIFYLSRLIERKLKSFDPRLSADDLTQKPYQAFNK